MDFFRGPLGIVTLLVATMLGLIMIGRALVPKAAEPTAPIAETAPISERDIQAAVKAARSRPGKAGRELAAGVCDAQCSSAQRTCVETAGDSIDRAADCAVAHRACMQTCLGSIPGGAAER